MCVRIYGGEHAHTRASRFFRKIYRLHKYAGPLRETGRAFRIFVFIVVYTCKTGGLGLGDVDAGVPNDNGQYLELPFWGSHWHKKALRRFAIFLCVRKLENCEMLPIVLSLHDLCVAVNYVV